MKQQCIQAVTQAAGRALSQAEIKGIEDRIVGNRKQLAIKDPATYRAMSEAQQLQAAAKMATQQLMAEAIRKKAETIKNAQVVADFQSFAAARVAKGDTNMTALQRMLAPLRDMMGGTTSVAEMRKAIAADLQRNLGALLDATGKWGGLFTNKQGVRDVIFELFGQDSGNALAKKAAKAWHEAAEAGRQQFNAEGGNVGKLEGYAMPQVHDQAAVWKAGKDAWVAHIFGKLDRSKYVNADGSPMSDTQLVDFLGHAHDSIAQGGAFKRAPQMGGGRGTSRRADSGSEHRQLHFKDAESYIEYQQRFGTGDPVQLLFGHFHELANDIALVKKFGPNPDYMVQHLADIADQADRKANADPQKSTRAKTETLKLYDFLAGRTDPVHSEALKYAADVATGINVAARLGSATISAINDQAVMVMAAQTVRMPLMKLFRNQLAAFNLGNRAEKHFALRQGLMHEAFTNEVNRWGTDNLQQTWAGRLAGTVLRASGLHAFSAAEKRAFGLGMYDLMGRLSRDHADIASMHADDAAMLNRMGVGEEHFAVWKLAETESRSGAADTVLTPDAIYAVPDADVAAVAAPAEKALLDEMKQKQRQLAATQHLMTPEQFTKSMAETTAAYERLAADVADRLRRDAAQKLIGVSLMETDVAVPTPSDRLKFEMTGGLQRGTWKGEIMRQLALFKATPWETFTTQWGRMMAQDGGFNRTIYAAKFLTLTTLMGAFTLELNEILQGKDPKDFTKNPVRAGLAAVLKGGGLGFFGDFMFSDKTLMGQTGALAGSLGPSAGTLESLLRLTVGNAALAMQGKKTHAASDAADLAKSLTPGLNLWYAKAVVNHLWMHYIQEALQPGYANRVEQRARKEFNQQYWWRPSEGTPQRGPNIGAAVGQ
jgi:hypothetical protein